MEAASVAIVLLLSVPSSGSSYIYTSVRDNFSALDRGVQSPTTYLSDVPGYSEAMELASLLSASELNLRVLTVHYEYLSYYFRLEHIVNVGDFFGPGRYSDLVFAVESDELKAYLRRIKIGAVMIAKDSPVISQSDLSSLLTELKKAGYKDITAPGNDIDEFVAGDVLASAQRRGTSPETRPYSIASHGVVIDTASARVSPAPMVGAVAAMGCSSVRSSVPITSPSSPNHKLYRLRSTGNCRQSRSDGPFHARQKSKST